MKNNLILIGTILAIFAISISMAIHYTIDKTPQINEITSERELSLALNDVRERITEKFPITIDHVLFLISENVNEYHVIEPNKMNGVTYSTHQNYDDIEIDMFYYENGTRSLVQRHDDGTILKEITIHDDPENPVMVLVFDKEK